MWTIPGRKFLARAHAVGGGFHIRPRSFTSAAFYSSNHRSRGSANTAPQSSSRAGSLVRWVTWLSM